MGIIRVEPSEKKKLAIIEAEERKVQIGDKIEVFAKIIGDFYSHDKSYSAKVVKLIDENTIKVIFLDAGSSKSKEEYIIDVNKDISKKANALFHAGAEPFVEDNNKVKYIAYSLESILFITGFRDGIAGNHHYTAEYNSDKGKPIYELNWNPYIIDSSGAKQYYQRDFIWTLEDEQLLIESIYNGIDCGRILLKERSYKEINLKEKKGETELFFRDLVDGKQRLNAVFRFLRNEFSDLHGNYYSDLSDWAQHKITNNQLFSFATMDENTTDAEVIEQFLKVNFTGRVMSKEHIEFVKSIKMK